MQSNNAVSYGITGGTTRTPRMIRYTDDRLQQHIQLKAQIMKAYKVSPASRVAIVQPFEPWMIGTIHKMAAYSLGAQILPLGLTGLSPLGHKLLTEFRPTVLCISAALMTQLLDAAGPEATKMFKSLEVILHAGEFAPLSIRERLTTISSNPTLANIYGMAEFDAIGSSEPGDDFELISLSPKFEYAIDDLTDHVVECSPGIEGQLCISENFGPWHRTGDRVQIVTCGFSGIWKDVHRIRLLGRTDNACSLPDGTLIAEQHILELCSLLDRAELLQVQIRRITGQKALIHCVFDGDGDPDILSNDVVKFLSCINCDLADSLRHSVADVTCSVLKDGLHATTRGKFPLLVEVNQ